MSLATMSLDVAGAPPATLEGARRDEPLPTAAVEPALWRRGVLPPATRRSKPALLEVEESDVCSVLATVISKRLVVLRSLAVL
jgi:hypothetical protein